MIPLGILAIGMTGWQAAGAALPEGFADSFRVAKSEWHRGEPVRLVYRVCNTTDRHLEPCRLRCGGTVRIFRGDESFIASTLATGCSANCSFRRWEPGECSTSLYEWPQTQGELHAGWESGPPVAPGRYFATIGFTDGELTTNAFEILAQAVPVPATHLIAVLACILGLLSTGLRSARKK